AYPQIQHLWDFGSGKTMGNGRFTIANIAADTYGISLSSPDSSLYGPPILTQEVKGGEAVLGLELTYEQAPLSMAMASASSAAKPAAESSAGTVEPGSTSISGRVISEKGFIGMVA